MKIRAFTMCIACLLLAACAPRYATLAEAEAAGARMRKGVTIDGVDVSGMTLTEAGAAVRQAQEDYAEHETITIVTSDGTVAFPLDKLPIAWDTDAALLAALCGERAGACTAEVGGEELRAALAELVAPLEREAQDAAATYEKGAFLYAEAVEGVRVDVAALSERVRGALKEEARVLQAEVTRTAPGYTLAQAKEDTAQLAYFSTSFAEGSYGKSARVHNIRKAAALIDGVRVEPGEEFDMNAVLGARNEKNGWKQATAIRDGAYTQEYGGGVCQVSTTLYNAVLMADLPVTERTHHSWPLGYVDIGRDATISTGGPNFKFRNNTDTPVYIGARTDSEQKTVSVRLYGRVRTDGLTIRLSSKKVETLPDPGDELRPDASLAPGSRVRQRESRAGSIAETYKLYYNAAGELVRRELVTTDKYRPLKGVVYLAPDAYYGANAAAARLG